MDIDSPPAPLPDPHAGHNHLTLPPFSASFPLPFRVLFLIGLAQFLWATNLHLLNHIGLDTAWILDFRDQDEQGDDIPDLELDRLGPATAEDGEVDRPPPTIATTTTTAAAHGRKGSISWMRPDHSKLHQPVYKLFLVYSAWVGGGWVLFRLLTGGDTEAMERWRGLVGVIGLGAIIGAIAPWRGIGERERVSLRRAIRRILFPPLDTPVFFSDVILADILTSFAKVLGDMWISACQLWNGGITQGRVAQTGWANHITLAMVCLPYLVRFRQCMLEAYQSSWTTSRPVANALKYFSAFPVILLSAAQKAVVVDVATSKGLTVQDLAVSDTRWHGEHLLFRLWLLSVVVNSMFSFWWDIQMDWGLALCELDTWSGSGTGETGSSTLLGSPLGGSGRDHTRRTSDLTLVGRMRRLMTRRASVSHRRSPHPTPAPFPHSHATPSNPPPTPPGFFAFGLRSRLLLPDPIVYHLFALIDLVLRFTWSLKLSSHLHTISEIESGVFVMEALELVRRWMWVFVRVEWEAVKMNEARNWRRRQVDRNGTNEVIWEEGENEAR